MTSLAAQVAAVVAHTAVVVATVAAWASVVGIEVDKVVLVVPIAAVADTS